MCNACCKALVLNIYRPGFECMVTYPTRSISQEAVKQGSCTCITTVMDLLMKRLRESDCGLLLVRGTYMKRCSPRLHDNPHHCCKSAEAVSQQNAVDQPVCQRLLFETEYVQKLKSLRCSPGSPKKKVLLLSWKATRCPLVECCEVPRSLVEH